MGEEVFRRAGSWRGGGGGGFRDRRVLSGRDVGCGPRVVRLFVWCLAVWTRPERGDPWTDRAIWRNDNARMIGVLIELARCVISTAKPAGTMQRTIWMSSLVEETERLMEVGDGELFHHRHSVPPDFLTRDDRYHWVCSSSSGGSSSGGGASRIAGHGTRPETEEVEELLLADWR